MTALKEIIRLVENFDRHRDEYHAAAYNEAQVRKEFIDPFFEALGWDMANRSGKAEDYKDVLHEASLKMPSGATKAPDYAFRIGGVKKFFLEAKKPSHDIKEEIDPAYQLRRYAWSAKLPLSVLTDFEEFAVYDCRIRPRHTDKADRARIQFWTYRDYVDKWDKIAGIFSKDAIEQGSFDKFVESAAGKRGTSEVDSEFLSDIEKWRDELAHNIATRNRKLSPDDLNAAVQRTIDRIIFLRMCEDRGIEPYGQLQRLLNDEYLYSGLLTLYGRADKRYNSGLFHFEHEKGRGEPDTLTPTLNIDNEILKKIIASLYYPDCPYEFSVLPAEILGNVYEQFLGKVIRLTKEHHAKVEEKPEVKKAGGVYYTPKYIVDYIVKNTVGKLCEGKTPKQISQLRILDPACGSGSFLLGAYTRLLDYHRDWYAAHKPDKSKKEIYKDKQGHWHLTTAEKKRILLNNVYGVDIDLQAVEVTKLSLLLKVLEGENAETLEQQTRLFHERALPDLDNNIKCGNSLIGTDYFAEMLLPDPEEMKRVNPFDWKKEFPEIFNRKDAKNAKGNGGFDCVIGNPPYSAKQSIEGKSLRSFYGHIEYKCDPYAFFVEQSLRLVKKRGLVGYIIPVTWMTNFYYMKLRQLMLGTLSLKRVVLVDGLVFKNANVDTCLLFLAKEDVSQRRFEWLRTTPDSLNRPLMLRSYDDVEAEARYDITPEPDSQWLAIKRKCEQNSVRLDLLGKISLGLILRSNDEFISETKDSRHPDAIYFGDNISRYGWLRPSRFFNSGSAVIVGGTKKKAVHEARPKILIQSIRNLKLQRRIVASLDTCGESFIGTVSAFVLQDAQYDIRYILGLLNSNLLNTYFKRRFTTISIKSAVLGVLPIHLIDFNGTPDKARHDKMVNLVERMLGLHKQVAKAKDEQTRKVIQRQIDSTDADIDKLVYELYGLTAKEIAIVEGK